MLESNVLSPIQTLPTQEDIIYLTWNLRYIDLGGCVRRRPETQIRMGDGRSIEEGISKSMVESGGEMVCTWFVLTPSLLPHPHTPPTTTVLLIPLNPLTSETRNDNAADYRLSLGNAQVYHTIPVSVLCR